jgi:hypothetical protein
VILFRKKLAHFRYLKAGGFLLIRLTDFTLNLRHISKVQYNTSYYLRISTQYTMLSSTIVRNMHTIIRNMYTIVRNIYTVVRNMFTIVRNMYTIVRNMLLTSTSAICCFLGCLKLNLCFQGLASGRSASPTASGSLHAKYSHLFSARKSENLHRYCQWWARAINSSLYFRALIFFKQIKASL